MNIAEKLTSVAENVPKVYMAGAIDFGLKGKAEGRLVTFNNVHPIEHNVSVRLGSKNLFNKAVADITETEDYFTSGIHYTQGAFFEMAVEPDEVYTVSYLACTPDENAWGAQLLLAICSSPIFAAGSRIAATTIQERHWNTFSADAFTFKVPAEVYTIYFQANTVFRFKNFQIEKGTTPTAYTPYISDLSEVKVAVNGDNLFDVSKVPSTAVITNNEDGTITISGTYSARTGKTLSELCPALKVGEVVIFQIVSTGNNLIYLAGSNYTWNNGGTKVITEADLNSIVTLYGKSDSGTYTISQIWVSYGTTPTEYTEYVEPIEYTAKADGTVEGVRSISPVMNLSADAEGAIVSAECFLDPEAVVNELGAAIISIGGEI